MHEVGAPYAGLISTLSDGFGESGFTLPREFCRTIASKVARPFSHSQVFRRGLRNKCAAHVFCPMNVECNQR